MDFCYLSKSRGWDFCRIAFLITTLIKQTTGQPFSLNILPTHDVDLQSIESNLTLKLWSVNMTRITCTRWTSRGTCVFPRWSLNHTRFEFLHPDEWGCGGNTQTKVFVGEKLAFVYRDDGKYRRCYGTWTVDGLHDALGEDNASIYILLPMGVMLVVCATIARLRQSFQLHLRRRQRYESLVLADADP